MYRKLFIKLALAAVALFSLLRPMSVFALGEQPNNLSTDDKNFCNNIEGAYLTFGPTGNNELSFDTPLFQETNSKRMFYLDGEREVDLPGSDPFYSFRLKIKQDYLTQLFSNLIVTSAELTTDFPGANLVNDQQSFVQNDSNSSRAFSLGKQVYDFTQMKPLFDDHPVDMLNSKARFGDFMNNGYYQVRLKYTFNRKTSSLNCPIRFVVSPPIPKQYCDVTLNEVGGGPVQSRQISEGSTEYVFPIKNTSNYVLTFSEIDSNTLTTGTLSCNIGGVCAQKYLVLNSDSREIATCENVTSQGTFIQTCGVKDRSSSDFEKFTFEFGPGKYQFDANQEGMQHVLSLKDGGEFPKCRNVRLVAGLNDIESQFAAVPTGAPSRDLSVADQTAYAGTNKNDQQIAIANTVNLCETVPLDADCGGGSGSCVQKCLSCTAHITAAEQTELNRLATTFDENGSLPEVQLARLKVLQDKSSGLSSTHIWTALGCIPTDISGLIATIFTTLVGVLGGFILLCIIFEGMRIMTSAGNPEALKKAQEGITSCIIGFIVIFFSVLILRIIGVDILHLPWFGK